MKKVIVTAILMAALTSGIYAKEQKGNAATTEATQDEGKTKVDPATLPDPVKTTLAGDQYKGWTVSAAWQIKSDPVYYAIELKKDDKNLTVNIDKDGKVK